MEAKHQRPVGLAQTFSIPVWKCDVINMDFVVGLPFSYLKHDSIWVMVDRLTKSTHFLPIKFTSMATAYAKPYVKEIVRLHGTMISIISDRGSPFKAQFWKSFHRNLGTLVNLSTAFYPQTGGQAECTIQTLKDTLRACILDFKGNWDDHLPLIEFAYNNSYHSSIGMTPFEALYGRRCRSHIGWFEVGDTQVSPIKVIMRFGKKDKLSPGYIGPYIIIHRIGQVAYELELPPELAAVHLVFLVSMLCKYLGEPSRIIPIKSIEFAGDLSFKEVPVAILDCQVRKLRTKDIASVKVNDFCLWVLRFTWKHRVYEEYKAHIVKIADIYVRPYCRFQLIFWANVGIAMAPDSAGSTYPKSLSYFSSGLRVVDAAPAIGGRVLHGSNGLWCVAKPSVPPETLQEALNYACGDEGADCEAISLTRSCYYPDTVVDHDSYAFNSYWQKTKSIGGTWGFGGTAMLINSDPSVGFRENISKYQNDPTIMKELQDTTNAKGKKLAAAISKGRRKEVVKRDPLPKGMKYVIKTVPHHLLSFGISCNRNFATDVEYFVDAEQKESVTDQEKIKAHSSVKEVNASPSLMDFGEQIPLAEQTPPIVAHMHESTKKINMFGGTNHEQVLLKVDMNAIESFVKAYVDKRFDHIKALMKNHHKEMTIQHEEMKKQHVEMMSALKEKLDPPQKNDDENVVSTGDHKQDEKTFVESSLKFNFDDSAILRETIEVQNVQKVSSTEISSDAFQEEIDNIVAGISTPVVAMPINFVELSQKVNLPDSSLQTNNVEVQNEPLESTNKITTELFQKSKDNIIDGIFILVVAMQIKSVSPKEINDSKCHIHNDWFSSVLLEADVAGDALSGQDDYKRLFLVASYENSLINIIKGFNIPAALPWHLVDDVYIPVNCDGNFHWVLAMISLKKRCIGVYESMLSSRNRESSHEIHKLPVMLPTYLRDNGFLKNTEQTVWSSLKAYTDKMSQCIGAVNQNSFYIEYVEDIAQQVSGSL
ncbi:hypothetical protein CQW23_06375 [Capsicum baccatum]|uniref:Integrase catalytic domain-containing protein n=1 Tax=Capsicum baccatum TaxID=33114 RepID=A0A2G2X379_CAPBA|nr:hypothetical protein CQW23_06375 [Capsicum baccatum]